MSVNIKSYITKSRYGADRTWYKLGQNRWLIVGHSNYYRGGGTPGENDWMIDLEGGPCLGIGDAMSFYVPAPDDEVIAHISTPVGIPPIEGMTGIFITTVNQGN